MINYFKCISIQRKLNVLLYSIFKFSNSPIIKLVFCICLLFTFTFLLFTLIRALPAARSISSYLFQPPCCSCIFLPSGSVGAKRGYSLIALMQYNVLQKSSPYFFGAITTNKYSSIADITDFKNDREPRLAVLLSRKKKIKRLKDVKNLQEICSGITVENPLVTVALYSNYSTCSPFIRKLNPYFLPLFTVTFLLLTPVRFI